MNFEFLGKGLKFPFRFYARTGGTEISVVTSTEHTHIHESIRQILGTRIGERFMLPEFGSKLPDLVFEKNTQVLKGLIRYHTAHALKRWEKRISVMGVSFSDTPEDIDKNILPIQISYWIIQHQIEGNMVYPFFRKVAA